VQALRAVRSGAIRLDAVTAEMVGPRFMVEPDNDAFLLSGERVVRPTMPLLLGKPSACVGRNRELSMLQGVFSHCVEELQASAVLVVGPAGAGKTRVCREFLGWIRRRSEPVEVISGRADSLGENAPYGIIADALRDAAGVKGGEPLESRRQKLTERLGRHLEGERLGRVSAFLGEMKGIAFPDDGNAELRAARGNAQVMGDAMRAAWEDWLAAECAAKPVVLVLDDLQWGDMATVRLVDATLRNLHELPLFVLVLARPEIDTRFPDLWTERVVQHIKLGPLSRKASEQLVHEALGKTAERSVVVQIVDRAEGNPFYLEELVRAVASGRGDAFPDSVLGTVEARLDAEGPLAKRILRAASVFGDRFSTKGVAALLGGDEHLEEACAWLDHLAFRELITAAGPSARPEDATYVFRHALVREAAYATLTETDRALGHFLAGDWLEQNGSADALSLAEHFLRGGDPLRAVRWYGRAAEQALAADDLAAVVERASRGVACGARGEELGALRLVEAEAHVWRGELALAEQRSIEAAELLPPGSSGWFRAVSQVVLATFKRGHLDAVERWFSDARAATAESDARSAQISCLSTCAGCLIFGGRYAAADAALELLEPLAPPDALSVALIQQSRSFRASARGDSVACLDGLRATLVAFEQAGDRRNACSTRANLGFILAELGDFEGAEEALRAALITADRMGLHDLSATVRNNLGHVLCCRGQLEEARRFAQQAIETFHRQEAPRDEGLARTYLAKIELCAGDSGAAEREARAAAEALLATPPLRAAAVAVLARALLDQGRVSEALEAASEAFSVLEALGSIEEGESLVRLVHADALAAAGKLADFAMAIAEARDRLLIRASRISDPMWRERFLSSVPENARTLGLSDDPTRTPALERAVG
jgi:tetratricopeptide (TPR) repeat protein